MKKLGLAKLPHGFDAGFSCWVRMSETAEPAQHFLTPVGWRPAGSEEARIVSLLPSHARRR